MNDFQSLGLTEQLFDALQIANYASPTPIQTQTIPLIIDRRDVLGIAQTGTGKTAAFALPILHRLCEQRRNAPRKGCRVLVLAPTRELATQIATSFKTYGRDLGFNVAVIYGGVSPGPQRQILARGIDILVATPGRLIDHMTSGVAELSGTEILVLDEADQMLDLGFVQPLRRIVAALPKQRQTVLFSATMPAAISKLAATFLYQPQRVSVAPAGTTADRVSQRVIHVNGGQKRDVLAQLVSQSDRDRTIVFTRTKRGADKVARHLENTGARVAAIHGNKSQGQRERALQDFRDSRIDILVATDIAARGIDIQAVAHVINYELPDAPEAYVHRIGRTARAGASGRATSLCDASERKQLRDIERLTGQTIEAEVSGLPASNDYAAPSDVAAAIRRAKTRKPREVRSAGDGKSGPVETKSGSPGNWWERAPTKRSKPPGGPGVPGRSGRRPRRGKAPSVRSHAAG